VRVIFENLVRDGQAAWRSLRRARGFSAGATLTLALGIAGTTVMFALVQGVLLRPLPVRDQDRLLIAWKELRASGFERYPFGDAPIEAVARSSQLLESVAGVTRHGVQRWILVERGEAVSVHGASVTGRFFEVLGVEPVLGRVFTHADDVQGAENVLVLSYGLWQRRYAGSPDIIGRRLTLAELPFTVVGVLPPGLDYPIGAEAWRTSRSIPISPTFGDAARSEVDMIARLRPGVTIRHATGEIAELTRQYEQNPGILRGLTPVVRPFVDHVVGDVRPVLLAVLSAVGLVMLIATANVANLLLLRGETRRSELAVREALGAGRGRIVRQLLLESVILTLGAAVVGLAAASWSLQGLLHILPAELPRVDSVRIDMGVVVFTAALALLTSLAAGLAPVLWWGRLNIVANLRSGGRGATGSAATHGRRALVTAQVALAVVVVAASGLLVQSLVRLQSIDTGLAADRLVFVELKLPGAITGDPARHRQFLDVVQSELAANPMIAAATPVNTAPLSGGWDVPTFTADGQTSAEAAVNPSMSLESVHRDHFETFGMAIVRGRAFTDADRAGALDVAIVSEDVAARTWPGADPIGKRLKMGGPASKHDWLTVVGVAGGVRYRDLTKPVATLYLPSAQFIEASQTLALRTTAPLDVVVTLVRDRLRRVDGNVHVIRVAPFGDLLSRPLARPRFNALLVGLFGMAALPLATVGLYAVMAAYVRQREREIGLRVALGATAANLRRLILGEALRLGGLGVAVGLGGALMTTRLVRGLLFEVHPLDPWTLGGAALLLMAAGLLASWAPLRRATRIDPVAMLRGD
jgi:putative ABC transport system permease protein